MGMKGRYESIHQHQMMVNKVAKSESIQMTDYFFLVSLFLMLFWAIDPLQIGLDMIPGVKRFPSILLVLNFCFIAVGRAMFRDRLRYVSFREILLELRYLVAFGMLVVTGSLYAKFGKGIEETFLTMGVFTFMAPIMYWYTVNSNVPMKLLKTILGVFVFWAVVAAVTQISYFQQAEIFHNREHLVLPVLATFLYFTPWKITRPLAVCVVVLVAAGVNKNTGYIITVLSFGYLMSISFFRRWGLMKDPLLKATFLLAFFVIALAVVASAWVGYSYLDDHMPSGNPEYRLHTYQLAWNKFLASPIWGNGFTDSAVVLFNLYSVAASTQYLPTHSDPLDILGNGGILAGVLWVMAVLPPLWSAFKHVGSDQMPLHWRDEWVHQSFLLMSVMSLFVCMFNPIYNVPNLATANWMAFGFLLTSTHVLKRDLTQKTE